MSNLIKFLMGGIQSGSYVESGVVLSPVQDGKYLVSINGKEKSIESTVSSHSLVPGTRVVINKTSTGRYIIGTTRQITSQTSKEIIING